MKKILPVAIVIINYNTRELLSRCLVAIFKAECLPIQLIVVDNNSNDGSQMMVKKEFSMVNLIESEKNLGFAGGNNLAIKQLTTEQYVFLLNSDTEIGFQTLSQLYDYMENHLEVGGVVPQLIYPNGSWQAVGGWFPSITNVFLHLFPIDKLLSVSRRQNLKLLANYPRQIPSEGLNLDYGTGAALFLRKIALNQVGLLREEYFMYFEETDLCWRLRQKNWLIRAIATDPVVHVYGGSFKAQRAAVRLNFFWKSLIIFVKKNYHSWRRCVIIAEVVLFNKLSTWLKNL